MKLQILQLDPADDQVSIRDKLARVKSDRVLLVWPRRGHPLPTRLDLVLVQRKARDLGLQVGLLSHDPEVQDSAKQIGLPLFASVEAASSQEWPEREGLFYPTRPRGPQKKELISSHPKGAPVGQASIYRSGWFRFSIFSLAIVAMLMLVASLAPSATLVVQPDTTPQRMTANVWLVTAEEDPNLQDESLEATVRTVVVQVSDRIETSGLSRVPDEAAVGEIRFSNLTEDPVTIPAGTSVRASDLDGVRFITIETAELTGSRGAQVDVQAQATEAGPDGNISPESIDAVDGPLGLQIQVSNPEAFSGGSTRSLSIVTEQDRRQLRAQLEQALIEQATLRLKDSLQTGESLVEASVEIAEIQQMEFDAEPGQAAASLGLTIEAEMRALSFAFADLRASVERQLMMMEDDVGQPVPNSLSLRRRQTISQGERLGLQVTANWEAYYPPDTAALRRAVAGKPREVKLENIEEHFNLEISQAYFWPGWLPNYPLIPSRIAIQLPWQTG